MSKAARESPTLSNWGIDRRRAEGGVANRASRARPETVIPAAVIAILLSSGESSSPHPAEMAPTG